MGLLQVLGKAFAEAAQQVTQPGTPQPKAIHFTTNFQLKAKSCGLSEKDATDVYYHGSLIKPNMMVRKYNGYELGIWFFNDHLTGQPIITSIWKRGDANPLVILSRTRSQRVNFRSLHHGLHCSGQKQQDK